MLNQIYTSREPEIMKRFRDLSLLLIIFMLFSVTVYGNDLIRLNGKSVVLIKADSDSGSTSISFQNISGDTLSIMLNAGNIFSFTTDKVITANVLVCKPNSQKCNSKLDCDLMPDSVSTVEITINGFENANEAYLYIRNHETIVDTIYIYKEGISFNIGQDFIDQADPKINLLRKTSNIALLKNEDDVDYLIAWSLVIPELHYKSKIEKVLCPAKGSMPIEVKIPDSIYKQCFTGYFKDQEIPALIKFEYVSKSNIDFVVPIKTTKIKAILQYWPDNKKAVCSYLIILLVIALGAATSLTINLYIPNKLTKLRFKRNLDVLKRKIVLLTPEVDSGLRVFVGVERINLVEKVAGVRPWNPEAPLLFAELKKESNILRNRVDTIQRLDNAFQNIQGLSGKLFHAPAGMIHEMVDKLNAVSSSLMMPQPEDGTFKLSNEIIQLTDVKLKNLASSHLAVDTEFAKQLAGSVLELRENFAFFFFEVFKNNGLKDTIDKHQDVCKNVKSIVDNINTLQNDSSINPRQNKKLKDLYSENEDVKKQIHLLLFESKQLYTSLKNESGLSLKEKIYLEIAEEAFDLMEMIYADRPDYSVVENIGLKQYHKLSSAVERLYTAVHVIRSWKGKPIETRSQDLEHNRDEVNLQDAENKKNFCRQQAKVKFMKLLKSNTWDDLQVLRRIRDEIERDIFDEEIKAAIKNMKFTVKNHPINPAPNQIVKLDVEFNDKNLDSSSAKHNFKCIWVFDEKEVSNEEGWQITHYFKAQPLKQDQENPKRGHVEFRNPEGEVIIKAKGTKPKEDKEIDNHINRIKKFIEVDLRTPKKEGFWQRYQRNFLEMMKLSVIVFIAIIGLIAGAKEELEKLDVLPAMVAIFMIGYLADSIKKHFAKGAKANE